MVKQLRAPQESGLSKKTPATPVVINHEESIMTDLFSIAEGLSSQPDALLDQLQETLRTEERFAELFDVMQLQGRHELGLPVLGNLVLEDLPEQARDEVAERYREDCRTVGALFLERGDIVNAWSYFGTIREPDAVAAALDATTHSPESDPEVTAELIKIGFGQGANPTAGYRLLLEHSGTCEGISVIERGIPYSPAVRANCIELLARQLHRELCFGVRQELVAQGKSVSEQAGLLRMIAEYPELFANDRAHVDDAHLQAVIRFSVGGSPEIQVLARELCEYGVRLGETYQHSEEAPFQDFYRDYLILFSGLTGVDVSGAVSHFAKKVEALEGNDDQFAAEFLVLLCHEGGRAAEALQHHRRYLMAATRSFGVAPALPQLCESAGDFQLLLDLAREQNQLVQYASALLAGAKQS